MALPKGESKSIKSVKNLNHMSDTELFDDIVELWEVYGNGLDLEKFIEIYNEYLTDKDISTETMSSASYVGYMIIFYSTYQDRDYR
jgi:hypothetical protein